MTKLSIIAVVGAALLAAVVVGLWSSSSAAAAPASAPDLKCYRVQRSESKLPPGRLLYISDQFEEKNLIVKNPVQYCSLAEKAGSQTGSAAGIEPEGLVCYGIKDAPRQPRFRPVTVITRDQFSESELQLTKPYSLCEPADKEFADTGAGAGFDGFAFDDFEFKCYRVRRAEHGNDSGKNEIDVFDQFEMEAKSVRIGRPTVFCAQVEEKKNKAKNNHIEEAHVLSPTSSDEYHGSTIGAGTDRDDPDMSCAQSYGHSVFFTYTPAATGNHTFDTIGSTYDTVMAIYEAGDPPLELECNDNGYGENSLINVGLSGGEKYIIVVGSYLNNPGGKLKFHLDEPVPCDVGAACSGAPAGEVEPQVTSQWNLVCYSISQRAPGNHFLGTIDQLNAHLIEVGRGNLYCAQAIKCEVIDGSPSGKEENTAGPGQSCNF